MLNGTILGVASFGCPDSVAPFSDENLSRRQQLESSGVSPGDTLGHIFIKLFLRASN